MSLNYLRKESQLRDEIYNIIKKNKDKQLATSLIILLIKDKINIIWDIVKHGQED